MTTAVRFGIPALMLVAGVVLVIVGGDAGVGAGIVLIGSAGVIVVFNLFAQLSVRSQDDREREEAARQYYARHRKR